MSIKQATIGLIRPKSPTNVGAVMRAAGCFSAAEVFYSGNRYDRAVKFSTDKRKQNLDISLTAVDDLLDNAPKGSAIVCIELVLGAEPLHEFSHPDNAFYIFGPEDGSIDQQILNRADSVVYIPTVGCLNLAATVNVVLYDRLVKSDSINMGDQIIQKSRDNNNTTAVNKH